MAEFKLLEGMELKEFLHQESEPLLCDECNALLGFVYALDLNGSHFFCRNCKEKVTHEEE